MEKEALYDLARAIAPHIAGKWRFNEVLSADEMRWGGKCAVISNDQAPAERIELHEAWNQRGRLKVAGAYPKGSNGHATSDTGVTVAAARDVRSIGRDITARFLPGYRKALAEQQAHVTQRRDDDERFAQLLAVLGSQCKSFGHNPHGSHSADYRFETTHARGTVRIYQGLADRVDFDLRVSFDDAVRLLAWLNRDLTLPDGNGYAIPTSEAEEVTNDEKQPGAPARADEAPQPELRGRPQAERQDDARSQSLAEA